MCSNPFFVCFETPVFNAFGGHYPGVLWSYVLGMVKGGHNLFDYAPTGQGLVIAHV